MTCDPCKITVNPETLGFAIEYERGGTQPEFKFGGVVVKPGDYGLLITSCQIPRVGPTVIVPEPEPIPPGGDDYYIWLNPTTIVKQFVPDVGLLVTDWDKDSSSTYVGDANLDQLGNDMPASTVNGLDVCRSANTNSRYLVPITSVPITSGFTIYVVGGFDSIVNDPAAIVSGDGANKVVFENAGGLLQIRGSSIGVLTSMAEDTNGHVWAARIYETNYRSRISGDPSGWVTSSSAITQDLDYLAVLNEIASSVTQAVGWVGEVIINTSIHSDEKMDTWYADLLTKWGL